MEFTRQGYLWLLVVIPIVALFWGIGLAHQHRMRSRFGNIANLRPISKISRRGRQWLRGFFFVAALGLMAVALAYPRAIVRELRPVPVPTDLVFLLDTSPSMYARDMDPSRLGRAERIIQRFIALKQPQDRYSLISFNWTSVVLSYMTSDPQNILLYFDYLNQQDTPAPGTNVGSALTNAMHLVASEQQQNVQAERKRRVVFVLLSDGDDTAHELEKPLAEVIRSRIRIYTVGLGTANGAYVPMEMAGGLHGQVIQYLQRTGGTRIVSRAEMKTMREISERTGGRCFRGETDKQIEEAMDEILLKPQPVSGFQSNAVRRDLYVYFLVGAFGCLLAGVFL